MGNAISPCFQTPQKSSPIKLIFHNGTTQFLTGKRLAGEIMFQHPNFIISNADSFFIGQPIPSLSISDQLIAGNTYFILPIDKFASAILTVSFLTSLNTNNTRSNNTNSFNKPYFDYIKGANGRIVIKVVPEFLIRLLIGGNGGGDGDDSGSSENGKVLCSTPELKKHYDQLVGCREQLWSPKLDTISERKIKTSPIRFIRTEQLTQCFLV